VSLDSVAESDDATGLAFAAVKNISAGSVSDPLYGRVWEFKYGMNAHGIVVHLYGPATKDFHDQLILTAFYQATAFTALEADSMACRSYEHIAGNSLKNLTVHQLCQVQSSIDGPLTVGQKFTRRVLWLHAIECPSYGP
jgi:hypothetical protein